MNKAKRIVCIILVIAVIFTAMTALAVAMRESDIPTPTEDEEIGLVVKSRELSYGEYVGRVVYAKRTQKLLEFEIYETKPQE